MIPAARIQAAIEILGRVLQGAPAERELTAWARGARYAGSKDRAAVRDHVFDALRRLRSAAWAGGCGDVAPEAMDPARVMAGLVAGQGGDPAALFTGEGHAPSPVALPADPGPAPEAVAADLPDWIWHRFVDDHGPAAAGIADALRSRGPVTVRANLQRGGRDALARRLDASGIAALPNPVAPTALTLTGGPRGLTGLQAFLDGGFEMQDAGSQALVARLPDVAGRRILDLCAGGGGKALALAARGAGAVAAHDADPRRMRDLPARARRAGAAIAVTTEPERDPPYDAVVADVPCSGSGSWRRAPEAKWRLTPERLSELCALQDAILDRAVRLVRPGGWIGYMTCSVLSCENAPRAEAAAARHGLTVMDGLSILPGPDTDGFHLTVLRVPGRA